MCRFGSNVSVIGRSERLMSREDEDVCEALQSLLQDEGINIFRLVVRNPRLAASIDDFREITGQ